MLGVILALVAVQLGWTSIRPTDGFLLVVSIGVIRLVVNVAVAFVVSVSASLVADRWSGDATDPSDIET